MLTLRKIVAQNVAHKEYFFIVFYGFCLSGLTEWDKFADEIFKDFFPKSRQ